MDLSNEVALVTGGSRNIGLAIAQVLAVSGARVCIWGGSDAAALRKALDSLGGAEASRIGMLVKVEDEDAVVTAFDQIEKQLGTVSVLINNAALRPYDSLNTMSLATWTSVLEVILTGAFLTSRELFRRLPKERSGAIVNIGGLSAHLPATNRAHVITAKAGLIGLTRALAQEGLGRVRVNCVVPGAIKTGSRPGGRRRRSRFLDDKDHAPGHVEDVASAVLSLANPNAQYLTGQTVHVSGGRFMP
jgi:3-oxoacyl-[acyl-carrier protein] reductase